ncbi:MAG: carbohydrate-binding protein [Victivallaceae bacterium]|nr:carbohydrate-binding protein [Victivallaceae bacterium]
MKINSNNRIHRNARTTYAIGISLLMLFANILSAGDIYEAEEATLNGVVSSTGAIGFSGSGFVDYINRTGDYIEWNISTANTGNYKLNFRYALASGNRPLAVTVNGVQVDDLDFAATGSFSTWNLTDTLIIKLPAGTNKIRATAINVSGANIDYLELTAFTTPTTTILEAENVNNMDGVNIANNQTGFSGTGFVDYVDAEGAYVEWNVDLQSAGDYSIQFGYALSSGDRPLSISINGNIVQPELSFPATGSFTSWSETSAITVALNAGINTIRATAIGSSGANVDYLKLVPIVTLEAEDALSIVGANIASNQPGFSGTGFVDYVDAIGAYVEWEVELQNSDDYNLLFGYALSSGDRPLSISVNGELVQPELSFPATGSFTSWSDTLPLTIRLNAGINTIKATAIGASGANVDYLKIVHGSNSNSDPTVGAELVKSVDFSTHPVGAYGDAEFDADWGFNNTYWVDNLGDTTSIVDIDGKRALDVVYRKNVYGLNYDVTIADEPPNHDGEKAGFLFWYYIPYPTPVDPTNPPEVILEYKLRFGENFEWRMGGKLPGLAGGTSPTGGTLTGSLIQRSGFSSRLMWHRADRVYYDENGDRVLVTVDDDGNVATQLTPIPEALPYISHYNYDQCGEDGDYHYGSGNSFLLESGDIFVPKREQWYTIRIALRVNRPYKRDGSLKAWIDGKLVTEENNKYFIYHGETADGATVPEYTLDTMLFSTFFGGNVSGYAPQENDVHVQFTDFKIWVKY